MFGRLLHVWLFEPPSLVVVGAIVVLRSTGSGSGTRIGFEEGSGRCGGSSISCCCCSSRSRKQ